MKVGMTKVLSVDDSPSIRALVEDTLAEAGFEVFTANDGIDGIEAAKGEKADLVLADVNMPRMDGIEMVRKLRELPDYKFTPILMLTTEVDAEKKKAAKSAGATGWLVKPFEPDALIATIKKVLP
mgnify:CR=1 FL=1